MKRKIITALSIFIVVILSTITYIYMNYFKHGQSLDLSYNDTFPKIDFYSMDNQRENIDRFKRKYKVIFYLSNHCQACINDLPQISRLINLYDSNNFDYIILWENGFSDNRIRKEGIQERCFTLKNKVRLSSLTPKGYILDENNKVIFVTDAKLEILADKIFDLQGKPDVREKSYNLLLNDFRKRGLKINEEKASLIMFSTDSCESCTNDKKIISEDRKLNNKFNIFFIDGINSFDSNLYIDYLNMYSKAFKVDFYPSYGIIEKDAEGIKFYSNLNEILTLLE